MFDTLTDRLDGTFKKLRSRGKLHPKQVDNALADMRTALLEADVAVEVADDFLERVASARPLRRGDEEPHAGPAGGEGRERGAHRHPRGRAPSVRARRGAPRRGHDGRRAGLRQDDRLREARDAPQGQGQAPAVDRGRPRAPRGRRAAPHARPRDRRAGVVRGQGPREGGEAGPQGGRAPGRRRRDHRHRGSTPRRPRDDEAGPQDQGCHEAPARADGRRRDDRSGRRGAGA